MSAEFAKSKSRAAFTELVKYLPKELQRAFSDLLDSVVFKGELMSYVDDRFDDHEEELHP